MNAPFIDIHTHQTLNNDSVISITNYFPNQLSNSISTHYSVGVHPCDVEYETQLQLLTDSIQQVQPQAIGECGYDRNSSLPLDIQTNMFHRQAEMAQQFNLPMIIHCVGRFQELIASQKKLKPSQIWIVHGFTGSRQLAEQLTDAGFILSFGAALITGKGKAQEALQHIQPNSFFLETDEDNRFSIADIYAKAAEIRNIEQQSLIQQINALFSTIF